MSSDIRDDGDACIVWSYLAEVHAEERADFAIGFGHFDVRIARHCATLYAQGVVPKVVFTGGQGSGSADLSGPEAHFLRDEALTRGVPDSDVIVEAASTNTPQNWANTLEVLASLGHEVAGKRFILVATPYRQRRVRLTCAKALPPGAELRSSPVRSSLAEDVAMFASKGEALRPLLAGEVDRIVTYGARGDILSEEIPGEVQAALFGVRAALP